jgi:hypothetical protein
MKIKAILTFLILISIISCTEQAMETTGNTISKTDDFEQQKAAILTVLNDETKADFNRDYEGWKTKWVHESYVTKTYMDFSSNSMTETLDWEEIDDFVRTYIEEHPEPAPLPTLIDEINVRLFDNTA